MSCLLLVVVAQQSGVGLKEASKLAGANNCYTEEICETGFVTLPACDEEL